MSPIRQILTLALLLVPALAAGTEAVVIKVIVGGTIKVGGEEVRLQGIEPHERDQPHGAQAKATLKSAILHWRVRLDVRGKDRYDRFIAVVHRDDRNINCWLVGQGQVWEFDRYSEDRVLGRLEREARRRGRRLCAATILVRPWDWRQRGSSSAQSAQDPDCSDFAMQAAAQRFYERHQPVDQYRLDRDNVRSVCKSL